MDRTFTDWLMRERKGRDVPSDRDGTSVPAYVFNPFKRRSTKQYWRLPMLWNQEARVARERRFVYCYTNPDPSLDRDLFEPEYSRVPPMHRRRDQDRARWRRMHDARQALFTMARRTNWLDLLFVTRYPERIPVVLSKARHHHDPHTDFWSLQKACPRPNWWFGVRVTSELDIDRVSTLLMNVPAVRRFALVEPLQEEIDIRRYLYPRVAADDPRYQPWCNGLDWVVAADLTKQASSCNQLDIPPYHRALEQIEADCTDAGVPFLVKTAGRNFPASMCAFPKEKYG